MSVVIETTIGHFTVDLFVKERPKTCLNFLKLCRLKYYNFNLFHSIQPGFIAQTGDPTGEGKDGESVWGILEGKAKKYFEAEMVPKIKHSEPGLLSMVSAGDDLVSSQFLLTLGPDLASLDNMHCVIGEVVEGHEVLRKLNEAICDEKFRPYQDIRITHTVVLEDPFPNPRGFREPSRSPSPSAERLKNGRIAADEEIDDTEGKTAEEIQEMLEQREAKARATILEIVGDIPDADIAPPENVLFVCKLNPVTTDDDLTIIFSRFGKIKGCEVIRDKTTGDSLQYAFIEFEEKKSCEDAYFKMDNVLIDDRRIHVDFSQSVSKYKWKGKGRGLEIIDGADDRVDTRKRDYRRKSHLSPSRSNSRSTSRSPKRRNRSPRRDRRDMGYRNNNYQNNRYRNNFNRNRNFNRNQGRYGRSPRRFNPARDFRNYHNWKYDNMPRRRSSRDKDRDDSRSPRGRKSRSRSRARKSRSRSRNQKSKSRSRGRKSKSRSPVYEKKAQKHVSRSPVAHSGSDSDYKRDKQVKKRKASTPPRARSPSSTPEKKKKKRKHKRRSTSRSDSSDSGEERKRKKKKSKKSSR